MSEDNNLDFEEIGKDAVYSPFLIGLLAMLDQIYKRGAKGFKEYFEGKMRMIVSGDIKNSPDKKDKILLGYRKMFQFLSDLSLIGNKIIEDIEKGKEEKKKKDKDLEEWPDEIGIDSFEDKKNIH